MENKDKCIHMEDIKDVTPNTPEGCEECLKSGDSWVALRMCKECGHVGCCDSSVNQHATKHFHDTKHPVMQAYNAGDQKWLWCYIDELMAQPE